MTGAKDSGEFNYGAAELGKVNDADQHRLKIHGSYEDGRESTQTHWLRLSPEQYAKVKDLITSFGL